VAAPNKDSRNLHQTDVLIYTNASPYQTAQRLLGRTIFPMDEWTLAVFEDKQIAADWLEYHLDNFRVTNRP
jgi:hypothetical protein